MLPTSNVANWFSDTALRFKPAGGAVHVSVMLARRGLRVGLVSPMEEDTFNRSLLDRVATSGVDVGGVRWRVPASGVLMLDAAQQSRPVVAKQDDERVVFEVPPTWSPRVLLLSGLSPVVSHAGSLCKAARAARRAGAIVVVDLNLRWHVWAGRDPRALQSVVKEADVIRLSTEDLAVLELGEAAIRGMARPDALFVVTAATGISWATGSFGEVAPAGKDGRNEPPSRDALTAGVCAELARSGETTTKPETWARVLARPESHP